MPIESTSMPARKWQQWKAGTLGLLNHHPILASLFCVIVIMPGLSIMATVVTGLFGELTAEGPSAGALIFIRAVPALVFILILHHMGLASNAGFTRPQNWKQVWLIWLPALYIPMNLVSLIGKDILTNPNYGLIADTFIQGLSVAFLEETTFRGLVLALMLNRFHATRYQIAGCLLFSSLLFSVGHVPSNPYWEMNVAQWFYTFFAGVGFAGVLLRTRNIWLLIAVHSLIYTASIVVSILTIGEAVPTGEAPLIADVRWHATITGLYTLPLFFYGLFLIRAREQPGFKYSE